MEYWLKCGEDSIQLPIRPGAFEISQENTHQTVNVQTLGDVSILGKRGLKTFSFESFFPAHDYPFADYPKDREPWDYIEKISGWQEKKVQFIITETKINTTVLIQSLGYSEEDGTGDIKYSLSLAEYRAPKYTKPAKAVLEPVKTTEKKPTKKTTRTDSKKKTKTHVVGGNDTLWSIAKKYYGSGSYADKIYNANKNVIEKAAKKNGFTSSSKNGVKGWWIFDGTKLVIP